MRLNLFAASPQPKAGTRWFWVSHVVTEDGHKIPIQGTYVKLPGVPKTRLTRRQKRNVKRWMRSQL